MNPAALFDRAERATYSVAQTHLTEFCASREEIVPSQELIDRHNEAPE